jgi:hypothetical protein
MLLLLEVHGSYHSLLPMHLRVWRQYVLKLLCMLRVYRDLDVGEEEVEEEVEVNPLLIQILPESYLLVKSKLYVTNPLLIHLLDSQYSSFSLLLKIY